MPREIDLVLEALRTIEPNADLADAEGLLDALDDQGLYVGPKLDTLITEGDRDIDDAIFLAERYGESLDMKTEPRPVEYVDEGWWHVNCLDGRVHEHTLRQSATMHRLCEPVFTRRGGES